ncbi:tautomerase family protein [Bradyrhizobium sp. U87765 SZCCT0131]|uniref:tautomerase family protein n=1 Tax=unclassified Bradyrhizobium TaxID=2631580 RepID=UPI001BA7F925|nr:MULTISPECIES: tautomerase family protein [unclassified Bradyrhizobium]MBR1218056.1 tautomerase family protein [Bradyrhizobium sp. U87765 SZCCT0131]MBR1260998.1 tautomerase family protein [Bradyrhizobium sp. U87765 SZCCT0134]MBR1303554.1 tautomerase family protein [Bradyrhizobium sp. U87765 SZCCT0110]MBR1319160.1 tautomerase family protein [Bradyrhizobium sp. U87765 SZCCT0109]MBR1347485.1 tautomerase family protein [Bradyrhizobium sp. U87765 SZCCT0048]
MPLLRFDLLEGRSATEVKALLDAVHEVLVEVFGVPLRDRYQIVHQHKTEHFLVQDTGLGLDRSKNVVVLQVVTRPRSKDQKLAFYRQLCHQLKMKCGLNPQDLIVSLVQNTDEDWSFGLGEAQFVTGALGGDHSSRGTKSSV